MRFSMNGAPQLLTLWEMAKPLIRDWQAEAMPTIDIDVTKETDLRMVRLVEWAGVTVSAWRRGLDEIPKNSSRRRSRRPAE
jgi:hypothetical protein